MLEKQTPILTTFLSGDSAISLETKNKKDNRVHLQILLQNVHKTYTLWTFCNMWNIKN